VAGEVGGRREIHARFPQLSENHVVLRAPDGVEMFALS